MAFVIIDLEFNNLSGIHKFYPKIYEENPQIKNLELINEIIQVGAIKVDSYMKPIAEMRAFIKPSVIPVINPNILQITGIDERDLENGVTFYEAMDELKALVGEDDIICSWAKDDIIEIIRNSNYHNYKNLNWIHKYLDLQEYVTKILGFKKPLSLTNGLKQLKIKHEEEKLHDALNDAKYEFQIFKSLYNTRALKNYIIKDVFNMPALEVKAIHNIEIDYDKVKSICPRCGSDLIVEYSFKNIGWRFVSLGTCSRCNIKVLNELVMKKNLYGDIIYKEMTTHISDIEYSKYEARLYEKNRLEQKIKN